MTPSPAVLYARLMSGARLRHLQAYVAIAELGSAKRAADSIGLTQPAVTNLVNDLEQLLECTLFQRHARGMRMTEIGRELLPFVKRTLASLERGTQSVAFRRMNDHSIVRVGAIPGAICGLLVRALPAFCRLRPDVMIELQEADGPRTIAPLVLNQEVDLMLCRASAVRPEGWEFSELMPDRLVVVAGPQHPLAAKRSLNFVDLLDEMWLLSHPANPARRVFDKLMEHHSYNPQSRKIEVLATPMVQALLQSERLVTLVPYTVFRQLIDLGHLVMLDVTDIPEFQPIGVLSPNEKELGEAVLAFKVFLYRYVKQHP
jgi:DNA-binding transcriptional LysR family regulator